MSIDQSPYPLGETNVEHVQEALRIIQDAQNLINHAAQELCPVDGFADEWSESVMVHDAIKEYWHRVNSRLRHLQSRSLPGSDANG